MKDIEQTDEFKNGRMFEELYARYCTEHGAYVVPYCQSGQGHAPMMDGPLGKFGRLPDLLVSFPGHPSEWRECKWKSIATLHRLTNILEHGIDVPCYRDYQRIEEMSGINLALVVAENSTGAILRAHLATLKENERLFFGDKYPHGMAYFPRTCFREIGTYTPTTGQLILNFFKGAML